MADPIKKALTRRRMMRGRWIEEEPNERLVLGVKFAIGMTAFMWALELAHIAFLHSWNAEIFASITGLSGTVIGVFVGQKA
ncbi:hypothetical protein G4O51_03150 [Candidatus Bathyarchaeota archaeon A05DMB-2]|nr:hypothetical protein [Candidatus Bathyarchaeota archaeon A05DMB-2]